jgi:alkylhydroperoxidase family enzyme
MRLLPYDEWSEHARTVLPGFLRRPQLYTGPDAQPMPQALRLFAHHVPLATAWMGFTDMLIGPDSTLELRLLEIAILRTAWQTGSVYEWKQHTRMGLRAGLTTEHLYAVPEGSGAPVWTRLERAVLDAVDQIVRSYRIDDATWNALAGELETAQILELMFAVGGYACFAAVTNSVGLQPDPPTEHVDAPEMPDRPAGADDAARSRR